MAWRLLPIGSFARRCRLSIKALRHYDDLGLLRPARVDAVTGYRYYDRRQAPAAIAIALLRSLDVTLPAIRELLAGDDPDALARVLDRERARRAREIAQAETALRSIKRLMRAGTVFPYDVVERHAEAQTLLVVEGRTTADLHVAAGTALVDELLARRLRDRRRVDVELLYFAGALRHRREVGEVLTHVRGAVRDASVAAETVDALLVRDLREAREVVHLEPLIARERVRRA